MTTSSFRKRCGACKVELDVVFFGYNKANADGMQTYCKPCRARSQRLVRSYKASVAERRKCDICGVAQKKSLCVDHDHGSGTPRGQLCGPCNSGLGMLKDAPVVLASALRYLHIHGKALTTEQLESLSELHHPAL